MTTFAASVTRSDLGLAALNINDHTTYRVANEIMGGNVTWDRKTVSSPYVNGDVTIHRRRGNVSERFGIYVYGSNQTNLQNNVKALIDAFSQNSFTLSMTLDSVEWSYRCEASDYQIEWSNAHLFSNQVRVLFNLIRNPIPILGA